MKGSIHSDQVCPICGARFRPSDGKKPLFCPAHPQVSPTRFVLRFGRKITKRFDSYEAALQVLTGLRYQEGAGTFDARDYQVKTKPLAFGTLVEEWLELKAGQVKHGSWRILARDLRRAGEAWGNVNIKGILYPQVEDFFKDYPGAPKTKANALATFKQFWAWAADRYGIQPLKKWPRLGHVEMAFRLTVDIPTQEAIIDDIKAHEQFRVWLCVKWLATYIAVRPGEMRGLTEGQVDRGRGVLIIPHPKEKRAKVIPLIQEDIEAVRALPLAFSPDMPFFRHERNLKGRVQAGAQLGHNSLYRAWKRACARLGIQGVPLYPGTKHSTAMGLRAVATPEEIKSMTLHSTSAAFHRYFQTGGEALRELQERRKSLAAPDNTLITPPGPHKNSEVFKFPR